MKLLIKSIFTIGIIHCAAIFSNLDYHAQQLEDVYKEHCDKPSDINQHLPTLKKIASQCESVTEIGIRSMVSTWAILKGLLENNIKTKSYLGIDIVLPPKHKLQLAKQLSSQNDIDFKFLQANDMKIDIAEIDMLFIDSLHTYCHLTYELEKFSPKVKKYIVMHDTSPPWEKRDDNTYRGNFSEYPKHINKYKRGLWLAVEDFLKNHPEWTLHERHFYNHGLTVLKRI